MADRFLNISFVILFFIIFTFTGIAGCDKDQPPKEEPTEKETPSRTETHGKDAAPNYDVVFPQQKVNRIDIVFDPAAWQRLLDDMTERYGQFGETPPWGEFLNRHERPDGAESPETEEELLQLFARSIEAQAEGAAPEDQEPPSNSPATKPIWQPCRIELNGIAWEQVGFRFKGLSTLSISWWRGILKIPFRLDFDQFEDEYPETKNQRFFGFKRLTMTPGLSDDTLIREKMAADIFRDAGVPAAMTAFYRAYIDYGEGPIYFGLYTMVEDPNGPMLDNQFENGDGNLYKPEGTSASFARTGFMPRTIEKKTNEKEADWSDMQALHAALHSAKRSRNPEVWRSELEAVLNVEEYLRYLAVNAIIENWDTYGRMGHNYYLYSEPRANDTGYLIHWIPWDNNMSLTLDDWGFMPPLSISLDEVNQRWPLIRFLMDDPVYQKKYVDLVEETINGAFELDRTQKRYQAAFDLIKEYVVGENGEQPGYTHLHLKQDGPEAFDIALEKLIMHAEERQKVAREYITTMRTEE